VLTEQEVDVVEHEASRVARKGDILFCRMTPIRGVAMLFGCSSYAIPPDFKPSIIELRSWMRQGCGKITEAALREYDFEIREEYLEIGKDLSQIPVICNTDGERLNIETLHYEIDSPEIAFSKLAGLCVDESEAELRARATLDDRGEISKVEIPWPRRGFGDRPQLQNTILGTIVIDGGSMKVTVNSAERAEMVRKEIETRLGRSACYRAAVIESTEHMMTALLKQGPRREEAADAEHNALMQIPEVRETMAAMVASHWEGWVDEKIPALGGKTPRQVVKTADGQESVEALLCSAERAAAKDRHIGEETLRAIESVRQKLHLPRR